ncbi:YARHG domain-containing protein [Blautia sp. OF03-15BH]|uniref:YARHG domain-containing protein n=1 Tax=Blautia sp. OF03-15BH TaxID=2292287 RepID=UPI000E53F593|nr:YARHG domain-containing protein [Blautia sp. OF03-15BH]RGY01165.1 YARHG domain-containing protein [Blautia sp. OF03-15BH]
MRKGLKKILPGAGAALLILTGGLLAGAAEKEQEYIFPDTDKELLTEEDVKDLPAQLLAYGRYEILAKHGELFESEELKDYFGTQKWYFGFLADEKEVEGLLNDYEKENLDFLKKQEKAEGEYELDQKDFDYELVEKWLAGTYVPGEEETGTGGQEAGTEKKEEESSGKKKAGAKKNSGKETEKAETEAPAAEVKETKVAETEAAAAEVAETKAAETEAAAAEVKEPKAAETEAPAAEVAEPKAAETEAPAAEVAETKAAETEAPAAEVAETKVAETEAAAGAEKGSKFEDLSGVDLFDLSSEIQETETKEKETEAAEDTRSEYIFADADTRYLTQEEVDKLSLQAVCYAKNEIYARHGRKFLSTELQEYFNDKSWYQGTVEAEKFSPSVFNKYESDNIQILVKAEEKLRSGGYLLDQPGYDIHKVDTACKHSVVKKEKTDESSGHTFIVIDSDNIMHDDARIVDGKVVDAKGQEIPGCSIREDGKVVDFFGNIIDPREDQLVEEESFSK